MFQRSNIYTEAQGGFDAPVQEYSPARALRTGGILARAFALQNLDGTWRSFGLDPELNQFISQIGPAIDLDICLRREGGQSIHRIVTWIEPRSGSN